MSSALFRLGIMAIIIVQVACLGSKGSGEGSVESVAEDDDMSPPSGVPGWTQYNWRNEFNFSLPSKLRGKYIQSGVENHHAEVGMMEAGEEDSGQDNSTAYWEIINSTTTSIDTDNLGGTEVIPRHVKIEAAPVARRSNEAIPLDEVAEEGDEGSEEVEEQKKDTAHLGGAIRHHVEVATLPAIAPTTEVYDEIHHQPKPFGKGCKPKLDLVYLLDTSGSIQQIYQEHVKWAVALVDTLPVEKDIVRIAAIQYAGFPLTEFALGTYPDARDIREHLMKINFQSGITRTGYALRKAEAELFHIDRGAREGAKKAIILFTDGLSIDDPSKPAEQLRNLKGVSIYVVNLSSDGFEQEIDRIAGNRNNVFGQGELNRLREAIITELEGSPACLRHGPRKPFTTDSPSYSLPALLSSLTSNSNSSPTTSTSRSPLLANSFVFTATGTSPPTPSAEENNVSAPSTGPVVRSPNSTPTRENQGVAVSISRESPIAGSTTGLTTSILAQHIENGTIDAQEWEYEEEEEVQPITPPIKVLVLAGNESIVQHQASVRLSEVIDVESTMPSTTISTTTSTSTATPTTTTTNTTTTPQKFVDTTASPTTAESHPSQTPISAASTISNAGYPTTTVIRRIPHRVRHLSEHIQHLQPVASIRHRSMGIGTIREFPILLRNGNGTANKSAVFLSTLDIASQEEQTHNRGLEMSTLPNFPTLVSLPTAVEPTQPTPHPTTLRVAADSDHRTPTKSGTLEVGPRKITSLQTRSFETAPGDFRLHAAPIQHVDSEEEVCPIDWLFIIDSSGSVQRVYQDQKRYLEDILEQIQLGNKAHRVALLQFAGSEIQKTEWNYDTHNSSEALMKAFGRVRLITGTTFIGKALESALHILNSRRREVPSVAVLLSDGFSQDDASQAAEKLRRMLNLDFYAISMSELSNTAYLTDLVGTEDHVFVGERRADLKELLTNRIHCQHR